MKQEISGGARLQTYYDGDWRDYYGVPPSKEAKAMSEGPEVEYDEQEGE